MSEPRSALDGARFEGLVTVEDLGLIGMITLRADLSHAAVAAALDKALGLPMPPKGCIRPAKGVSQGQAAWMSPDEILLILPYGQTGAAVSSLEASLAGTHHLVQNVSDARAVISVTGPDAHVREVLAKLAPVDLHPASFTVGDFRRSRMAQVAGAFWMPEAGRINAVCFRSVAVYVFDLLKAAADPAAAVDYFG
ncbi:MAG: sarcosine oxidase subunit gamma [Rhodobacterales bacterium]